MIWIWLLNAQKDARDLRALSIEDFINLSTAFVSSTPKIKWNLKTLLTIVL